MKRKRSTRLVNVLSSTLVLAVSLLLIAYVGFGEAQRTYPKLEMDKLAAQGDLIGSFVRPFLLAGLPLNQFPGFELLTTPLLGSDPSLEVIYITRKDSEEPLFLNKQESVALNLEGFSRSAFEAKNSPFQITQNTTFYRVSLPLEDKFELVGYLHLLTYRTNITETIQSSYRYVWLFLLITLAIYLMILVFYRRGLKNPRFLRISYSITFFIFAAVVVVELVNIYVIGIQNKAVALTQSLVQRINAPIALGLRLDDLEDLDRVFQTYQELNPDIGYIALTKQAQGGQINLIHTDASLVGEAFIKPTDYISHEGDLIQGSEDTNQYSLFLGIPITALYSQIWRGVKNFIVLFVATIFLASLLFNLKDALIQQSEDKWHLSPQQKQEIQLGIIQPFYFLVVFVEGLSASFLPQYMKSLAATAGVSANSVSTVFTIYFLGFVASLLPAGSYAEKKGIRPLFITGGLLSVASFIMLAFVDNFFAMYVIRFIAGISQGLLYIAVQSYILEVATERRTGAASIIVFGYNGGNISGTAIGALLAVYMGFQGVFLIGAVISFLFFLYAFRFIPRITSRSMDQSAGFVNNVKKALSDSKFVSAMLFIGIPAKAVLTGVTVFALPLILSQMNYPSDDIGQILMLYAAGVLISSRFAADVVDRTGKAGRVLVFGTIGSGIGLILMGLIGWPGLQNLGGPWITTATLMAGMLILGLSHGFVHAPIVTHVSDTPAAVALGKGPAASLYRFLERMGHVSGPLIVSQIMVLNSQSATTIGYIGIATCIFGLLFSLSFLGQRRVPPRAVELNA